MALPFAVGTVYSDLPRLLIATTPNNHADFAFTIGKQHQQGVNNNIQVFDPAEVDGIELPEDGLVIGPYVPEDKGNASSGALVSAFVEVCLRCSWRQWLGLCLVSLDTCIHLSSAPPLMTPVHQSRPLSFL